MSEVRIAILIKCRSGERAVEAWARAMDAALACHPIHYNTLSDDAWSITHRKSGLAVNPSRTYSKEDALALIDVYTPLTDWNAEPTQIQGLRNAVELAYEQFVPTRVTGGSVTQPASPSHDPDKSVGT